MGERIGAGNAAASGERVSDDDELLDVALEVFAELGLRRATVDDVAKRAGVGRVTIYRRIGGKQELIRAVLARESRRLFADVMNAAETTASLEERIAVSFAATVSAVRENRVWQRLLSLETDAVLMQLTLHGHGVLSGAVAATTRILDPQSGSTPAPSLTARAEVLVRITHSVLLTPHVAVSLGGYDELVAFASRYLVPIATAEPRA